MSVGAPGREGAMPFPDAQAMGAAARTAVGVVLAHRRRDTHGLRTLLGDLPDPDTRAMAFLVVADLALTLLAQATGQTLEDCAQPPQPRHQPRCQQS